MIGNDDAVALVIAHKENSKSDTGQRPSVSLLSLFATYASVCSRPANSVFVGQSTR